jgi:hypothetical protein
VRPPSNAPTKEDRATLPENIVPFLVPVTISPTPVRIPKTPTNRPTTVKPATNAPVQTTITEVPVLETPSSSAPTSVPPVSTPTPNPPVAAPPTDSPISTPVDDAVLDSLRQLLSGFFYDQSAISDTNSYQYRALRRTAEQEGFDDFSGIKVLQYWILYCIYFSTNAPIDNNIFAARQPEDLLLPTWKSTDGWEEISVDPCDGWYGISCNGSGRITEIQLQRNQLSGVFPPEVSFLAADGPRATGAGNLQRLEIYNNELLTNHPDNDDTWIESLGSSLEVLNYGSTSFRGPIPKLPSTLIEFDCSYTLHTGPLLESSFEGLDHLRVLILDGNQYNSSVPFIYGRLPSLKYLYIREASLTGDLSYMQGMPAIVEHLVDGNPDLSGPIYPFIGDLDTLRSFSAADCGLVSKTSGRASCM